MKNRRAHERRSWTVNTNVLLEARLLGLHPRDKRFLLVFGQVACARRIQRDFVELGQGQTALDDRSAILLIQRRVEQRRVIGVERHDAAGGANGCPVAGAGSCLSHGSTGAGPRRLS